MNLSWSFLWMLRFVCSSVSDAPYYPVLVAFPDELCFISSLYYVYMFKLYLHFKNYPNSSIFFDRIRVIFLLISDYYPLYQSLSCFHTYSDYTYPYPILYVILDPKLTPLFPVKNQAQCFSHTQCFC